MYSVISFALKSITGVQWGNGHCSLQCGNRLLPGPRGPTCSLLLPKVGGVKCSLASQPQKPGKRERWVFNVSNANKKVKVGQYEVKFGSDHKKEAKCSNEKAWGSECCQFQCEEGSGRLQC